MNCNDCGVDIVQEPTRDCKSYAHLRSCILILKVKNFRMAKNLEDSRGLIKDLQAMDTDYDG